MWSKARTRVTPINLCSKHGKRAKVDPIAILQRIKTVIAGSYSKYIGNTSLITTGCSHPVYIMIAPLNVNIMEVHDFFHNKIRSWASVKNVTYNMKRIDCKVLYKLAKRDNEFISRIYLYDSANDLIVIELLVAVIYVEMQKLIYGIGVVLRHLLADLGPGVLRANNPADCNESVDGYLLVLMKNLGISVLVVPVFTDCFSWIVYEIGKLKLLCL